MPRDVPPAARATSEAGRTSAPRSAEELTRRNIDRVVGLEAAEHAKASTADRVADAITGFCGSIRFVWLSMVLVAGWVVINLALPEPKRIDPFPFPLLTLMLSVEAIFLAIFILMRLNLLSEQENTKMLEMLQQIGQAVGAELGGSETVRVLAETTQPEALSAQIDRAVSSGEQPSDAG
jgi:uncharacterized membrane protein